jgi:hypothetical protein
VWVIFSESTIKTWISGLFTSSEDALDYLTSMPILSQNFGKHVMHHIKFVQRKDIGAVASALVMPPNFAMI